MESIGCYLTVSDSFPKIPCSVHGRSSYMMGYREFILFSIDAMFDPASLTEPSNPATPRSATGSARWQDIAAGLSIAGLLLPEAVAYSGIANLPPQAGVIGLLAGLLCYGLFGTSRFAIVSVTSSSAAVLAAATASLAAGDPAHRLILATGLVLLTGVGFLVAAIARIGGITQFIARPVLQGFAFGLALVIITKQLAAITGIHLHHADMTRALIELLSRVGEWHSASLALGLASLVLLFLLGRSTRVPGALVVIVLGVAAGKWLDLAQYGVELVGPITLDLATPEMPYLSQIEWLRLAELAVALVLVLYAETYGAIRTFATQHGDTPSPNRDLLALGAANLLSGLFHGMPVGAGYSATSANEAAGAMSRLAGWVAAVAVFTIVATLLPSLALTPHPVLAAIVIRAVSHTLTFATFRPYFQWKRDRVVVISSVLAVVILGVLDGLLAAIGISMLLMLRQLSKSTVVVLGRLGTGHDYVNLALRPDSLAVPGILILRPEEALFFANAERVVTQAQQHITDTAVVLDTVIVSLEESPDLDSSSLQALHDFATFVARQNHQLIFARLKRPVNDALARLLTHNPPMPYLTELSVDDAVAAALRLRLKHASGGSSAPS